VARCGEAENLRFVGRWWGRRTFEDLDFDGAVPICGSRVDEVHPLIRSALRTPAHQPLPYRFYIYFYYPFSIRCDDERNVEASTDMSTGDES